MQQCDILDRNENDGRQQLAFSFTPSQAAGAGPLGSLATTMSLNICISHTRSHLSIETDLLSIQA